ncbi:hypothetical protein Q4599_17095 [Cellulophaga lytica]|uniref:hypothetical protein n=1 Tax=Cellulophaga lytica TaxID=979 RepID=UPI0026E439F8|nr:hypothetical protein [Cellulophaga lytica]MDO6855303.1 hypothetical protein [Cellulophaga lytica]
MNEELIAKNIKNEVLIENFKRYFDILESSNKELFKDKYWSKAQQLYNSIDSENKENLKEFIKMVMIESVTEVLAFVDGIATFDEQEYPFELFYNNIKISGSLQEYLLMDIEGNGFK